MDDAADGVVFRLLGPLEIDVGGRAVAIRAAKVRTVLAVLLVHAGRVVSRDALADVLWGDDPPPSAANTLQTYISQLRRALTTQPVPGEHHPVLQTHQSGYLLRVGRDQIDAARFEDLVHQARPNLVSSPARATATLREALALWRGPALAEFAELGFAEAEIARLEEVRLEATEDLIRAELALGRHAEIVGELGALVAATPLHENLTGYLMLALYRSGRQADALRAYRYLRRALAEELGIDPSPALAALEVAILRQEPDLDFAPAPTPASAPGRTARSGPSSDLDWAGSARSPFVGRRSQLGVLVEACTAPGQGCRFVLVEGDPGIGKSRIVGEAARHAAGAGHLILYGRGDEHLGDAYRLWARVLPRVLAGDGQVQDGQSQDGQPQDGQHHGGQPQDGQHHGSQLQDGQLHDSQLQDGQRPGDDPKPAGSIPVDEADARRLQFFTAASAALAAASFPGRLVLVLDDLQWADVPSLLFLRHLVLEAPEFPFTVLGVSRLGPRPTVLESTVAALEVRAAGRHLKLEGLEAGDVEELVAHGLVEQGALPAPAARRAQALAGPQAVGRHGWERPVRHRGAPGPGRGHRGDAWMAAAARRVQQAGLQQAGLQQAGLQQAGWQQVPDSIRDVVRGRVSSLSPPTASLLVAAAVLGTPGSGPVLGRIAGLDEETTVSAIVEASDARFLLPVANDPGVFEFAHAVLRSAVYDDIPHARRLDLHRRAALALQAEPGPEARAAELARHWTCAGRFGDPAAAIRYRRLAGDAADRSLGYEQAASHYRAALALIEQYPEHADAVSRCEILLSLAATENRSGDVNAAKDACRAAAELAASAGQGGLLARAALEYGGALPMGSEVDDPEAQRLLRRALATVEPQSIESALVRARLAQLEYWLLPRAERRSLCDTAVGLARAAGDRSVLAAVLLSRYWALNCPDELDERLALTTELDGLADADGTPELWLQVGKCRLHVLVELGDLATAVELSQRLAVTAARLNYREHVRLAMAFDAMVAAYQGRFEDAARLTAAAQALMAQRGHPEHAALAAFVQQVPVLWLRGAIGQVLPTCRVVVERDPTRPAWRAVLGWVAAEAGDTDEARDQLAALDVGRFVAGEPAVDWWAALAACANAARILEDMDLAGVVRQALMPYAERNAVLGQVAFYGAVSHHLGVLAGVMGDDDDAVAHLEHALRRHEAMGAAPFVALTSAELAPVLARTGRVEEADALRRRATTITAELGLGYVAGRLAVRGPVGA